MDGGKTIKGKKRHVPVDTQGLLMVALVHAAACALPAGFNHELFEHGVIIRAADRPGDEDDENYIARLIALRDALQPTGFLNNPSQYVRPPR